MCITCCNTVTNAIVLLERRIFVEAQNGIMFNTNRSEARHNLYIGLRVCDKLSRMSVLTLLRPYVL